VKTGKRARKVEDVLLASTGGMLQRALREPVSLALEAWEKVGVPSFTASYAAITAGHPPPPDSSFFSFLSRRYMT